MLYVLNSPESQDPFEPLPPQSASHVESESEGGGDYLRMNAAAPPPVPERIAHQHLRVDPIDMVREVGCV